MSHLPLQLHFTELTEKSSPGTSVQFAASECPMPLIWDVIWEFILEKNPIRVINVENVLREVQI